MPVTRKSSTEIQLELARIAADNHENNQDEELDEYHERLQVDEMIVLGCLACPKDKTLKQREKFFSGIKFMDLPALLQHATNVDFV